MFGVRISDGGVRGVAVALVLACFLLPTAARAGASGPSGDSLDRLREAGAVGPAQYALARARSLFDLDQVRSRYGRVRAPAPRAATPILERLAAALPSLSPHARRTAKGYLGRPTDGASDQLGDGYEHGARGVHHRCFAVGARGKRHLLCVHWVRRTRDRSSSAEVGATIRTLRHVWKVEVSKMGYRAPLADVGPRFGQGPNRGLDIYLEDVGSDGLYGYCIGDPPRKRSAERRKRGRAHAYCVLDNDFATAQFPAGVSGRPALRVTVAHEFFHAIQSAYEAAKRDRWLREGTATWIEDAVFDGVNANYTVLPDSPLSEPQVPLDAFQASDDGQDFEYGSWIFWRFLSEYYGSRAVIRKVWEQASPRKGRNLDALEAVRAVVGHRARRPRSCLVICRPRSFRDVFAEFAARVRAYLIPEAFSEGPQYFQALHGQLAINDADFLLIEPGETTGYRQLRVDHLSNREAIATLNSNTLTDPSVRVTLDLPRRAAPSAVVFAFHPDGTASPPVSIPLDDQGNGSAVFEASEVWLILANASGDRDGQRFRYRFEVEP